MLGNTSSPIIFYVSNENKHVPESVTLFMSSENRVKKHHGNSKYINITFTIPTYSYERLLADSENEVFRIWKMRLDIMNHNPPLDTVQQDYYVTKRESDGSITRDPYHPYQDLDQTIPTAVEFRYPIEIDADKGITFSLSKATTIPPPIPNYKNGGMIVFTKPTFLVRIMIWTDKNVSLRNDLNGDSHEKVFVKPMPLELKAPYMVRLNDVGQIIYSSDKSMNFKPKK